MLVRVQPERFDTATELARLGAGRTDVGAIASFTGLVRADDGLTAMTLEHHPTMTLRQMQRIAGAAEARWPIDGRHRSSIVMAACFPGRRSCWSQSPARTGLRPLPLPSS